MRSTQQYTATKTSFERQDVVGVDLLLIEEHEFPEGAWNAAPPTQVLIVGQAKRNRHWQMIGLFGWLTIMELF